MHTDRTEPTVPRRTVAPPVHRWHAAPVTTGARTPQRARGGGLRWQHRDRRDRRTWLASLDPVAQAPLLYRTLVLYEFPFELRFGLNLAFYRTFAAPRIAALLARTGEMAHNPDKRAFDTGLIMYELIAHGYDHPRGQRMVAALNRMHGRWPIAQDDFRYVLSAFVVAPTRWVDRWGWRHLDPHERVATAAFYAELGRRMAIARVPATYDGFADVFDAYEDAHLAPTDSGDRLMRLTQGVIAEQLPAVLRPWGHRVAPRLTSAVIDGRLARCLGLPPASTATVRLAEAVFAARRAVLRRLPPAREAAFTPGMAVAPYPDGYALADLGVRPGDTDR